MWPNANDAARPTSQRYSNRAVADIDRRQAQVRPVRVPERRGRAVATSRTASTLRNICQKASRTKSSSECSRK